MPINGLLQMIYTAPEKPVHQRNADRVEHADDENQITKTFIGPDPVTSAFGEYRGPADAHFHINGDGPCFLIDYKRNNNGKT